jgi:hypothetical protein
MSAPFEIIAAPFTVYLAPRGEAFPDVDDSPSGTWFKLGSSGAKNYGEEGVTVGHSQTLEQFRTLGSTGPVKAFRTEEGLTIGLMLHDLSLEQYRRALNDLSVETTAASSGVPGSKALPLLRGSTVAEYALVLRGDVSPAGEGFAMQYQVPRVFVSSEPEVLFTKGEPAGLSIEFTAIEDQNASQGEEFGKLVIQTADAE